MQSAFLQSCSVDLPPPMPMLGAPPANHMDPNSSADPDADALPGLPPLLMRHNAYMGRENRPVDADLPRAMPVLGVRAFGYNRGAS